DSVMDSVMKRQKLVCLRVVFLFFGAFLSSLAWSQPGSDTTRDVPGVSTCLTCHNNTAITAIRQTPHGQSTVPGSPFSRGGCTDCHGGSETHVRGMQSPGVVFDDGTDRFPPSPITSQNQSCLNCHQSRDTVHWSGSIHQAADLACVTCHKIHQAQNNSALNEVGGAGICLTCHLEKRSQFNGRSHHPVMEGLMSCTDCHNPHGSDARALLARAGVVETCTQCHAEKRGPFLWEHQPVVEDCSNCHNPHGSTQVSMLTVRQPFLCQTCHSDPFHPSTLYSGDDIPPAGAAQQLLGSSCTNCHSTIHGSNHPSGSRLTR
ncbi:MAG: DmsE family decaheme c-type cytochrome, partial [Pseudohongiellaceae bacterium]